DLQDAIPLAAVAGQARHFQPQHNADLIQGEGAPEILKAGALVGPAPRLALVIVNEHDLSRRPAHRPGPLHQSILAPLTRGGVEDRPERRLAYGHVGAAGEMSRENLGLGSHDGPPDARAGVGGRLRPTAAGTAVGARAATAPTGDMAGAAPRAPLWPR